MEKSSINELKNTKGVVEVLANVYVEEKTTNSATPKKYLCLTLSNGSTTIYVNIWDSHSKYNEFKVITPNSLGNIKIEYKGVNKGYDQYEIEDIEILPRPSLIDCVDIEVLKKEFRSILMNDVPDEDIKNLLFEVCKDKDLIDKFFFVPVTEKSGYSFKGATLAQTVRLCKLCKSIVEVYDAWNINKGGFNEKLNISVLIAACFLNNIGNIDSYEIVKDTVKKTFKGELNESSFNGAKILWKFLANSKMPEEKKLLLEHTITSANGTISYGALNTPRTKEAMAFQLIRRLDSSMANFEFMERISLGEDFSKLNDKNYCILDFDDI